MTAITKLDVFNAMIATMGEAPYEDATAAAVHPRYADCIRRLERISTRIQGRGWWFNTLKFDATPDPVTGAVDFPCAILSTEGTGLDGWVIRGNSLYAPMSNEMISTTVRNVRAIVKLEWDDLPPAAQDYIATRATLDFQAAFDSTQSTTARLEKDSAEQWHELNRQHILGVRANRLLSTGTLAAISRARGRNSGGRTFYEW